jgi:hypothetical protein
MPPSLIFPAAVAEEEKKRIAWYSPSVVSIQIPGMDSAASPENITFPSMIVPQFSGVLLFVMAPVYFWARGLASSQV